MRYLEAEGFEALLVTYHGQNVFANVFNDSCAPRKTHWEPDRGEFP